MSTWQNMIFTVVWEEVNQRDSAPHYFNSEEYTPTEKEKRFFSSVSITIHNKYGFTDTVTYEKYII